jgi:beta-lactamase regulating signal transducer with metallopeptidase domain
MLWWFAETSLVAGLLAGLAAVFSRLRPLTPTTRHLLWLAVLIKFLTPPLISSPWAVRWPVEPTPATERTLFDVPDRPSPAENRPSPHVVRVAWPSPAQEPAASTTRATTATTVPTKAAESKAAQPVPVAPRVKVNWRAVERWLIAVWFAGGVAVGLLHMIRVLRFQRRLSYAVPAPNWLVDETVSMAMRLGVGVPEVLGVADLGSPMIWCFGSPKLLIPSRLLKSLSVEQWRGVLAHELAHLRRRDHWVRRLELAAELVWWWNPLYWVSRHRLDAEAELACDAWVVWTLPDDRLSYAQVLLQICSELSCSKSPAAALSVTGSSSLFERRLNMILNDQTKCRPSTLALMGVCVLSLAASPSWTLATPAPAASPSASLAAAVDDKEKDKDKGKEDKRKDKSESDDVDLSDLESSLESAFGPQFEKAMEAFGEAMEKQFGDDSEFAKKMEAFGEEMEKQFGDDSEFAKKMEAFGEQMEKQFGDDSEFAKKMEAFGEKMEKQFGEGSEFAKKMEEKFGEGSEFAKKMEEKFGKDSEFAKKMEEKFGKDSEFAKKIEEKFGKDSEFAKKMEAMGKELEKKLGPGSEFEAKMKKVAEKAEKTRGRDSDVKKAEAEEESKSSTKSSESDEDEAKSEAVKARDAERKARDAERKARDDERKRRHEMQAKLKAKAESAEKRAAERKERDSDRKKVATDRKTRLKALEAKLKELTEEIKKLESEDADEE